MENGSDADFGAVATEAMHRQAYNWDRWLDCEVGVGVKRSFSWNGFPTCRRRRAASPDLFEDFDEENPLELPRRGSLIAAKANESPTAAWEDISGHSIESHKGTQPIVTLFRKYSPPSKSIASPPKLVASRSIETFGGGADTISSPSPEREPNPSQRTEDIFSSIDVEYDTQSVDLFSECEPNADFTEARPFSPDLFDDSDSSQESKNEQEQSGTLVDLTQGSDDVLEPNINEDVEYHGTITDITAPRSQETQVFSQANAVVAIGGNSVPESQLVVANERLQMHSDPNILLERLLGADFVFNVPSSAPLPVQPIDDTTTYFTGDEISAPEIGDRAKEMLRKIEQLVVDTLTMLSEGKRLEFNVRSRRDWSNCAFDDDVFTLLPAGQAKRHCIRSTYRLALIFYLLGEIYEMIAMKRTCTLRELYYSDTYITEKQENVNEAMKLICCKLEVPPWQLGVMSSVKGLLAGKMRLFMPEDVVIDCALHADGMLLPHSVVSIERTETDAKFVLLVEKDTVFKKLVQHNVAKHFGTECILLTGKGYPDTHTRLMLKKIWDAHQLPIYALTDADPHGIEIMLTYRHGSLAMSNLSAALAVPAVRWIGIFPSDIQKFGIKSIPMTQQDRRKLDGLMNRPGLSNVVYRELQCLKRIDVKAEIEGLSGSSSDYLIDVYLRHQFDSEIAI